MTEKEKALAAELRAEGKIASAIILEADLAKAHWDLIQRFKAENVTVGDSIDALMIQTFATVHAMIRMVNKSEFTVATQVVLLERCLSSIEKLGKKLP